MYDKQNKEYKEEVIYVFAETSKDLVKKANILLENKNFLQCVVIQPITKTDDGYVTILTIKM